MWIRVSIPTARWPAPCNWRRTGAIHADLLAAGFTDAQKIYAVFFGGGSPRFGQIPCGQGGYPVAAIYLACMLERSDFQPLIQVHGLSKILDLP